MTDQPPPGRILVALVECDGSEAVIPETLALAGGTRPVTVLQVFDPTYSDKLCQRLREDGWMGASQSQEVGQAIRTEYHLRFDEACQQVVSELQGAGLDVRLVTRGGDLVNTVLRVADEEGDVQLIVVGHPKRSWLTRWFKDLNVRVLIDRAACDVRLVQVG